jgi:Uncharacterized protein predicted to be involved in DNA repair (RAMP superfamily)
MKLDDDFGARRLAARWIFRTEVTLVTPAHFGGSEEGAADMMLLRDRDGRPLLPGTSIAGALRSHLADRLGGYYGDEPPIVERLFGWRGDSAAAAGPQSSVIVFDSRAANKGSEIRDGVAIVPRTGVAEEHFKYDIEILPAGTTFPLRIDLLVPESGGPAPFCESFQQEAPATQEDCLAALLGAALTGFAEKDFALGVKRSRGFGRFSCLPWSVRKFDLSSSEGWMEWVTQDHENPARGELQQWPLPAMKHVADRRHRVIVKLDLEVDGSLQIASPSTDPGGPDTGHLQSAGKPVLPATSLAGAMRNRALRIARIVRADDGTVWVDRLFGPRGIEDLRASRLRISESVITGERRIRPTRVQIDRFTQGVVDGALFDEEPLNAGKSTVQLEIRKPETGETGLLLLILKDLLGGDLPIGGTASIGRGLFKGTATLRADGDPIDIRDAMPADVIGRLDKWINEFRTAPAPVLKQSGEQL